MNKADQKQSVTSFPQGQKADTAATGLTVTGISRRHSVNTLTLSDGTELRMPHGMFEQSPWRIGRPITLAAFEAWMAENEYKFCMERAGHALSARNRTEKELGDTLRQAGFRNGCVDRVLARLREVGYVDDTAFTSAWIKHRTAGGYGENRIRQELRMKGIDEETIREALDAQPEEEPKNAAYEAAVKAARGKDLSSYKDRQKVKAALARRGFDFDSIDEALRMLARQADDEWDE